MKESNKRKTLRHSIHSSTRTPPLPIHFRRNRWRRYAKFASLLLSLSIFSYLGDALRVFSEQLFGTACHEPGTVGWNAAEWTPCTTAPGTTESTGGALFADVPANMIGCFIIGFMVSGDESLGLSADLPVAFLSQHAAFQTWTMTHFSIRTAFCGALTTFASWNTQMVVMICAGKGTVLETQWVSALFGYVIGWMVAFQSFVVGRDAAIACHRRNNPRLAKEADALHRQKGIGMLVNRSLPNFERRYLYDIVLQENDYIVDGLLMHEHAHAHHHGSHSSMDSEEPDAYEVTAKHSGSQSSMDKNPMRNGGAEEKEGDGPTPQVSIPNVNGSAEEKEVDSPTPQHDFDTGHNGKALDDAGVERCKDQDQMTLRSSSLFPKNHPHAPHFHHLKRWKESTHNHRRHLVRPKSYISELHEIEKTVLNNNSNELPRSELMEVAIQEDWPVDALQKWKDATREAHDQDDISEKVFLNLFLYLLVLGTMTGLLLWAVIVASDSDPVSVTYRSAAMSLLMSPFGTFTRWQLAKLNGRIRRDNWEWFPLGTFVSNISASIVSAFLTGLALKLDDHWAFSIVEATIKGYAGSLSTVSIFAAEAVGLMQELPRHAWGYYYSIISLVTACILGVCSYVWAVV